jgi:hypothetical protein
MAPKKPVPVGDSDEAMVDLDQIDPACIVSADNDDLAALFDFVDADGNEIEEDEE